MDDSLKLVLQRLETFRLDRGWEADHTPRNLATSISIEAAELLEHFQWSDEPAKAADFPFVAAELADVLIYALNLAQILGVSPLKIVNDKITCNELRFPLSAHEPSVGGA
jgi:NTP pyrophosphatase (non-canonical NTP hydrolase)